MRPGAHASWILQQNNQKGGLFCQLVLIQLLRHHRILRQRAGHELPVIKLLPPLVLDERARDWTLRRFRRGDRRQPEPRRSFWPAWAGSSPATPSDARRRGISPRWRAGHEVEPARGPPYQLRVSRVGDENR